MARLRVSLAESAVRDLVDIRTWYRTQGVPEVGEAFVADILERLEALSTLPDLGRVVPEFGQPALRELLVPPFRVVCRREPKAVRVVRGWRSERLLALDDE